MKKDAKNQEQIGLRFLQEVDRLEKNNEIQTARDLLADVLKLPFTGTRREQLADAEKRLNGRVLPYLNHYPQIWLAKLGRHFTPGIG